MANLKLIYPDIPVTASAATTNATFTETEPAVNLEDGRRDNIASSSSSDVLLNYDLGSGNTQTADHVVIARADKVTMTGSLRVQGSSVSRFAPSSISGLVAWFDANRGVTVDADNRIDQWNDLSGNGNHATQGTTANKPLLSRWDNQENLLKYSEEFNQSEWVKGRSSISATNTIAAPNGTVTAEKLVDSTDSGTHRAYQVVTLAYGETMTASVWLKAAELTRAALAITSQNETTRYEVQINLSNGAFVSSTGTGTYQITDAGSGWWKLTITAAVEAGDTGTAFFIYLISTGRARSYIGTGTDGIYVWGAQLRRSTTDSTYLATTATPKIASVNGNRAIWFDGNQLLRADGTAATFSGVDKAATVFCVFNQFHYLTTGSGTSSAWAFGNTGTANPIFAFRSSNAIQIIRRDDAGTTKTLNAGTLTKNNTILVSTVFTGTTVTAYLNGVVSGAANTDLDVGTITLNGLGIGHRLSPTDQWYGLINELIVFNSALSSTDRANIEAYLTTKWQTAPVLSNSSLGSSTKVGPRANDYIATFSPSSAFRNWWVEFYGTTAFKPSKLYVGRTFDPAVDCDFEWSIDSDRDGSFISGSGEVRADRTVTPRYRFTLTWVGLTDAEINTFAEKIWKRKHKSGFFLYASGQGQVLDNKTLFHVRAVSAEWERVGKANYNTLTATFEEVL